MPHDPSHAPPTDPPPPPVQPDRPTDRPTSRDRPARDLQDGAFGDSVAGEEDPGAGVDTLTPRRGGAQASPR